MASFLTDRQSVTSPPGKLHDESRQLELGASGRCPPCSDGAQFTERLSELVAQLLVLFGEGTDPPICKFESSTNRLVAGLAWTPGDYRRGKEVPVTPAAVHIAFGGGRRDGRRSKLIVLVGELGRVVGVISIVEGVRLDVKRPRMPLQLLHATVQRCERGCCSTGITYRRAYRLALAW